MGYYIYADLQVKSKKEKEIIADFRKNYNKALWALDDAGGRNEEVSWCNYDEDLAEFSVKYPGVLFTLQVEGSGVMDFSVLYVKNGKHNLEQGQIIYPKYNSKKMKLL